MDHSKLLLINVYLFVLTDLTGGTQVAESLQAAGGLRHRSVEVTSAESR